MVKRPPPWKCSCQENHWLLIFPIAAQRVKIQDSEASLLPPLNIFVCGKQSVESSAQRLVNGGKAPVKLILMMDRGRELEMALGNTFTVIPQIKGAIKAIAGVVDVQDL